MSRQLRVYRGKFRWKTWKPGTGWEYEIVHASGALHVVDNDGNLTVFAAGEWRVLKVEDSGAQV